jgi:hypothetical protein
MSQVIISSNFAPTSARAGLRLSVSFFLQTHEYGLAVSED